MWEELSDQQAGEILAASNGQIEGLIGASFNNGQAIDYYIAATVGENPPANLAVLQVPATTWGVFECVGPLPESMVKTWRRIFAEWFPTSGYECAELPTLEIYDESDNTAADYKCEFWVPLVKVKQ